MQIGFGWPQRGQSGQFGSWPACRSRGSPSPETKMRLWSRYQESEIMVKITRVWDAGDSRQILRLEAVVIVWAQSVLGNKHFVDAPRLIDWHRRHCPETKVLKPCSLWQRFRYYQRCQTPRSLFRGQETEEQDKARRRMFFLQRMNTYLVPIHKQEYMT